MKIYNRSLEKETERFFIENFWREKEIELSESLRRIVDKIEGVTKEMRKKYYLTYECDEFFPDPFEEEEAVEDRFYDEDPFDYEEDYFPKEDNEYEPHEILSEYIQDRKSIEQEEFSKLIEMIRERHYIRKGKKILF